MEYFDKQALDNRSIEWIGEQLDDYQGIVSDATILDKYRTFYSKVMEELLEYYFDRYEADYNAKMEKQGEEELISELPF